MAIAIFKQDPGTISETASAAVSMGAVKFFGDVAGVALRDFAIGETAVYATQGEFEITKDVADATDVYSVGDAVLFKADKAEPDAGRFLGIAVEAAAQTDTTVRTLINAQLPPCMRGKTWEDVTLASGSKTLDIQDVGKVLNVTVGHATNVITLPAIAAGLEFVIRNAQTAAKLTISPNANDKIMGADLAGVDNKDRYLAAADVEVGNYIHLAYGSADGWMVLAEEGDWTAES